MSAPNFGRSSAERPAKRSAQPQPTRTTSSPIVSAALGFVAGVVFWHFVGFWDFMSATLFVGDRANAGALGTVEGNGRARPAVASTMRPTLDSGCTTLMFDPRLGRTASVRCPIDFQAVGAAGHAAPRGDLATTNVGGATPIAQPALVTGAVSVSRR